MFYTVTTVRTEIENNGFSVSVQSKIQYLIPIKMKNSFENLALMTLKKAPHLKLFRRVRDPFLTH